MKENWQKIGEINGPDTKNRVTITPFLKGKKQIIDGFTVYINPVGEIKLSPVVKIPAQEAWLYKNPEALNDLQTGIREALDGQAAPLSKFRRKNKK